MLDASEGPIPLVVCVNGALWRQAGRTFMAISSGSGPPLKRRDEARMSLSQVGLASWMCSRMPLGLEAW